MERSSVAMKKQFGTREDGSASGKRSKTDEPQPTARLGLTTVGPKPGSARAFEAAVRAGATNGHGETLWFRMLAGGFAPRYARLRPSPNLEAILEEEGKELSEEADSSIAKMAVEILNLRPMMCLGV